MAVELKPLPPVDAIAAFEARKGDLVETFSWQEFWQEEHATSLTVAKSAGFDILKDISAAFEKALKEGRTPAEFARTLRPALEAKGWWGRKFVEDPLTGEVRPAQLGSARRLQTIFDTNMRVSYAAGHWANFERNRKARPFLRYVCILDERTRPAHRARHNLVLPIDHPYWDAWAPPCGWNCRCTLQSLSQRDIDRLLAEGEDLRFEPPEDTFRNFVNSRTGEVVRVPDGIDPGWAYNPGRAGYEARVNKAIAEKIADAPPELVAAAVEERVSSSAFERFVQRPEGSMPVMPIPPALAASLGVDARVALLSAETMTKQLARHPEMTIADYRLLPGFPAKATLAVVDGPLSVVLIRLAGGRWLHAVIKATKSRSAAFLTSYRFTSEERVRKLLDRDGVRIVVDRRKE
ncbi:phage minor head protein [Shinella sp. BYT-45]|uniref:phage head morphogenesis protein n=1 Tax=Shinella sp. BYT-45 TaxID=3377377 RepID=UPI003980D8E0